MLPAESSLLFGSFRRGKTKQNYTPIFNKNSIHPHYNVSLRYISYMWLRYNLVISEMHMKDGCKGNKNNSALICLFNLNVTWTDAIVRHLVNIFVQYLSTVSEMNFPKFNPGNVIATFSSYRTKQLQPPLSLSDSALACSFRLANGIPQHYEMQLGRIFMTHT